jgi:hypothetical protein
MTHSAYRTEISDEAIWFKHVHAPNLAQRLNALRPEEVLSLEADDVVGRWQRMRTGKDDREVRAIRPVGSMKSVWNE